MNSLVTEEVQGKMREEYTNLEIEIIEFDSEDVIVTSTTCNDVTPDAPI